MIDSQLVESIYDATMFAVDQPKTVLYNELKSVAGERIADAVVAKLVVDEVIAESPEVDDNQHILDIIDTRLSDMGLLHCRFTVDCDSHSTLCEIIRRLHEAGVSEIEIKGSNRNFRVTTSTPKLFELTENMTGLVEVRSWPLWYQK